MNTEGAFTTELRFTDEARAQVPVLRDVGHVVLACNSGEGHGLSDGAGDDIHRPSFGAARAGRGVSVDGWNRDAERVPLVVLARRSALSRGPAR